MNTDSETNIHNEKEQAKLNRLLHGAKKEKSLQLTKKEGSISEIIIMRTMLFSTVLTVKNQLVLTDF